MPDITSVLFVGSSGLSSTEETIRTFCTALPDSLRRLPDGETGHRYYFVTWQHELLQKCCPALLKDRLRPAELSSPSDEQIAAAFSALGSFATGYDRFALESYEVFRDLKRQGIIPPKVRFQVCIPTPLSLLSTAIDDKYTAAAEPLYEAALLRAVRAIQVAVPASELAIQWDAPMEFAMLEGIDFGARSWVGSSLLHCIVERLVRIGNAVNADVELGFHLCYGDREHKHFLEPTDMGHMVDVAEGVLKKSGRHVDWIHMPVPKNRSDDQYFMPLEQLAKTSRKTKTELVLGLIHYDDLSGTRKRIRAAGKYVPSFGVGTECGLGRTPAEHLKSILEVSAAVSKL
ncbi:hypothetical protein LTR27_011308 [Elasticomyces elasticus]|nr:hypothetical protein LTR27_011308 [Elasticomyces elasticus]